MTLDMLYSTFNDGIFALIKNIPSINENVKIIIIHQVNKEIDLDEINLILKLRHDISYYKSYTKGVAISRNIAIEKSTSEIILFCDDDVIYSDKFYDIITSQYKHNPNVEFITFAYSNNKTMDSYASKFSTVSHPHNFKSILKVGTIEVTARRKIIIKNNIRFPNDMGAGTQYFLCDEPVFLSYFLKNKLFGVYVPCIICFHPEHSSGKIFNSLDAFGSRFLCFTRIFGSVVGYLLYVLYLMKNIKKFKSLVEFKNAILISFYIKHKI